MSAYIFTTFQTVSSYVLLAFYHSGLVASYGSYEVYKLRRCSTVVTYIIGTVILLAGLLRIEAVLKY